MPVDGPGDRPSLVETLELRRRPEGGWYRETWSCAHQLRPEDYPGARASATLGYLLLRPGEETSWRTLRSDEIWLHHTGGPVTLLFGGTGSRPSTMPTTATLGPDLAAGQQPQLRVPGGAWRSARCDGPTETLMTCLVSPGFHPDDRTVYTEPGPVPPAEPTEAHLNEPPGEPPD
ncbi:cupin domain-containing protein [Streptomyces sp. AJS327]|nr:cupin domain-containing protein [Streptomyces sp. AJS327]